jgi:uncharacterized repeat protein (TIGR03803 family)
MSRNGSLANLGLTFVVLILAIWVTVPGVLAQGKYRSLHRFTLKDYNGGNGQPFGNLIFDQAGNLYGTSWGSNFYNSVGSVFRMTPNPDGTWTMSVLHSFCKHGGTCRDGLYPSGGLVWDAEGNLYGTTREGGGYAVWGVVYKLSPNPDGHWSETVIHRFADNGQRGIYPYGTLVFDQAGNLYGTTIEGFGPARWGTVFKLAPNPDGTWTESVLYSFNEADAYPVSGVIFDQAGNLYGTTIGFSGYGMVFELSPTPSGPWKETVIHEFTGGQDGGSPWGGLVFDQARNLYGTTRGGGPYWCTEFEGYCGLVYEMSPNPDGSWSETVLHNFSGGKDGGNSTSNLVFDASGNLYGTTLYGGTGPCVAQDQPSGCGTVFRLAPAGNGNWTETVLHSFRNHPGNYPYAGVTLDAERNLYGTTEGIYDDGTYGSVFEIEQEGKP